MKDREPLLGFMIRLLISLGLSVALAAVLLTAEAAATLSVKDPLMLTKPLALATLAISSLFCGVMSACLNKKYDCPRVLSGAAGGALFSLVIIVLRFLPISKSVDCSVGVRALLLCAVVALAAVGALFCREKRHAHYKKSRRYRR